MGVYLPGIAQTKGVEIAQANFLISIIGISNTVGRVAAGWFSDFAWVNPLFVTNVAIFLSGICTMAMPLCPDYYTFVAVALAFGLFVAAYISLTSIVLVELLGLDNLTSAFGILILVRGVFCMVGSPVAGSVFDQTQRYDISFYMSAHGVSLAHAVQWLFFRPVVALLFFGVVPGLCKRLGEKRAFLVAIGVHSVMDVVFQPLYPVSSWIFLCHKYAMCLLVGMGPLGQAIDSRWFDQRVTAKFFSMKNLVTYGVGMLGNPLYAYVFDAKATTYIGRMLPYFLGFLFRLGQLGIMFGLCWKGSEGGGLSSVLDRIEREKKEDRASPGA